MLDLGRINAICFKNEQKVIKFNIDKTQPIIEIR